METSTLTPFLLLNGGCQNSITVFRDLNEASWCDSSLRLAFHSRNGELADEVRRKKKTFTWKERLQYYGAKHLAIYHVCRAAAWFPALFKKEHNEWL